MDAQPSPGMVVNDPEGSPVEDIKFLAAMPEEEYKKYRGEWLAVASGEIVAHGRDPRRTLTEGCRAGKGMPLMKYVYADCTEAPFPYYDPGW